MLAGTAGTPEKEAMEQKMEHLVRNIFESIFLRCLVADCSPGKLGEVCYLVLYHLACLVDPVLQQ